MMNVRSVAVLITLLGFLTIDALSQSNQVPDNIELQVLKDLFDSLDGPSWKKKTNWPTKGSWPSGVTSTEFRTWYGVTVNNGDIVYIDWSGNNLTGRLPSSIRRLSRLKRLLLSNNDITGQLPVSLSQLADLTTLKLDRNQFTGSIPQGWARLTSLHELHLNQNKLSGQIPSFIGGWTNLTVLDGSKNYFTSLPSTLMSLPSLTTVYFDNNDLVWVPDFGNYSNRANLALKLENNRLDFSQLERHVGKGIRTLTQVPQKEINDDLTHAFTLDNNLTLTARPATTNTRILWEKLETDRATWTALSNDDDNVASTYTRNVATIADTGTYRWRSTNSIIPGTTIQSEPVVVKTQTDFVLSNWCFQYKYDARKRMTHKKIPGADWIYMVYDDRDRLVMTQDGEQRKSHQWTVTKYDQLNRSVVTAIYTHSGYANQRDMADLISTTLFAESRSDSGTSGYTNQVFPTANLVILTVTYYDDYSFVRGNADLLYKTDQLTNQYRYRDSINSSFPYVTGLVTGTKIKVLDVPYYMTTVNYYDDNGRVVQTVSENYDAGIDRVTNNYDFKGKVIATRAVHSVSNLHWQNIDMMQVDGNFVKGVSSGKYGGGSSQEYISATEDGWVEATVTETNKQRYFGLSEKDTDRLPTSNGYCFYLSNSGLQVLESGQLKQSFSKLVSGERLRISREGATVKYYRNGELIYTSTTLSTTALHVDVSFFSRASTILNLNLSTARKHQTTFREFDYDHAGRLVKTWHSINDGDTVLLSKNEYSEIGQLIDKKLYGRPANKFNQSIDYRYNIRGWLTSINGASVDEQGANDGDTDSRIDLFGIDLQYNERSLGLGNMEMFNGNISAMQWRVNLGLGYITSRAYTFSYDPMNRLTGARQMVFDSRWQNESAFNEDSLKYDLNGNIMSLRRVGAKGLTMDKLAYNYGIGEATSNQLLRVSDSGDPRAGFKDGDNVFDDYTYDRNGNMTTDNNKGITVSYNILNLPGSVLKDSEGTIQYYYDATGRKLSQVLKDESGIQKKTTDYHGDFIYENDTLKFANTEEGRVLLTGEPEYQFHLKDHLGNVRMTFTTKEETDVSKADFETLSADFLNYEQAVKVNSELFDHTDFGETHYSARLNGSTKERIGLAKSVSVMPGDTVRMEVFAKYLDTNPANWSTALNSLMTSIANGTAAAGIFVDGSAAMSTGVLSIPWSGFLDKSSDTGPAPRAYLNYIIFDSHYNFVGGKALRLSTAAREYGQDGPHEELAATILIKEAGYVYIYLSNDNVALTGQEVEVYFDDFKVEHVKSPVVQSQDYYPFGVVFNKYSRENSTPNGYQFSGHETQSELNLDWVTYGARMYATDIGRWITDDTYAESYFSFSPYNFVRNNPVLRVDPTGNWDITVHLNNDREQYGYGIAIVTDRNGNEVFRFVVRAEGTGGRDRGVQNSDTPLGIYDIPDKDDIWRASTNNNRQTYGPNPRLVMNPESGEIVDTGRDAIRIHGGRQEIYNPTTDQWEPVDSPSLKKTHGCLRVFDTDIAKLKDITDALMSGDPDEIGGKVTVSNDLKDFLKDDGKDKEEQEKTKTFWRGFDEALGQGLDNLEQWLKANGFK